jgi:hypothetical protein
MKAVLASSVVPRGARVSEGRLAIASSIAPADWPEAVHQILIGPVLRNWIVDGVDCAKGGVPWFTPADSLESSE